MCVCILTGFAVQNCEYRQARRQDADYLSVTEYMGISAGKESEKHPANEDHDVGKRDLRQLPSTTAQTHTHTHTREHQSPPCLPAEERKSRERGWRMDTVSLAKIS